MKYLTENFFESFLMTLGFYFALTNSFMVGALFVFISVFMVHKKGESNKNGG